LLGRPLLISEYWTTVKSIWPVKVGFAFVVGLLVHIFLFSWICHLCNFI
jgi:hypothetical protein